MVDGDTFDWRTRARLICLIVKVPYISPYQIFLYLKRCCYFYQTINQTFCQRSQESATAATDRSEIAVGCNRILVEV